MESIAAVNFASATAASRRPLGWQMQMRVDYVVNSVMQTHRGMAEDEIAQAIKDELRKVGVVPNGRKIHEYATAISQLPQLPPKAS